MLEDIYKIGLYYSKRNNKKMEESVIPDKITGIAKVFCLKFDQQLNYTEVISSEFQEIEQYQYLLRKGSPNGINFGPTAQVTEVEKTLEGKIIAWFKNVMCLKQQKELAKKIQTELIQNEEKIISKIKDLINKKEKYLLTVLIEDKFPYEVNWMFKAYETLIKNKIFGTGMHKGTCYLCKQKQVPIVPEYGVYKFYTKDKPGFITGGFQEENFWRNCPVCTQCQPILNIAKQFMEENLWYRYYDPSFRFYIIPSMLGSDNDLEEILDILVNGNKRLTLQKDVKASFKADNEDIVYALKDYKQMNSFRLVLLQKVQSAERILLDIKDVYPSRFQTLYQAKDRLDKDYGQMMQYLDKDKQIVRIPFNFSFFREFLSKSDDKNADSDLNKIFLELTQCIFNKTNIELKMILPHYMRKIRRILETEESGRLKFTVVKAVMGLQYLQLIECIKVKEERRMETKYEEFFSKYNCGLNTNVKRALVLIGALVQKVMNVQAHEIKSTPFSKNLKSFRLREEEIKGIIAQAVNKLQEYDRYSLQSKEIVEEISKLIFSSEDNWKLSVDEMNFYLAAGMALQEEIYQKKEIVERKDDNNE